MLWRQSGVSNREFAEKAIQVSLAGPVAEMIYSGDPYHPGLIAEWAADWDEAWQAVEPFHRNERQRLELLERICIQLHRRFQQEEIWAALAALADNLLAHETLEGEEIESIVRDWMG